jgi:hypothetical protein
VRNEAVQPPSRCRDERMLSTALSEESPGLARDAVIDSEDFREEVTDRIRAGPAGHGLAKLSRTAAIPFWLRRSRPSESWRTPSTSNKSPFAVASAVRIEWAVAGSLFNQKCLGEKHNSWVFPTLTWPADFEYQTAYIFISASLAPFLVDRLLQCRAATNVCEFCSHETSDNGRSFGATAARRAQLKSFLPD